MERTGFRGCRHVSNRAQLLTVTQEYLSDYNATSKAPMDLALFSFALEHIVRICRVITLPGGNALLVGLGGSGRKCLTRLAAAMEEYLFFEIAVSKNYGRAEWHDDLRRLVRIAGESCKAVIFCLSDTQIQDESFVEDISSLLNVYEVPNLFPSNDMAQILENIRPKAKAAGMDGSRDLLYSFFLQQVHAATFRNGCFTRSNHTMICDRCDRAGKKSFEDCPYILICR